LSTPTSPSSDELIKMVRSLADLKARLPREQRGVIKKEYGVDVQVDKTFGPAQYTASGGRLVPDIRFVLNVDGEIVLRGYKPGDWEIGLKKAYDDLVAHSGAFGRLSIDPPESTSDMGKKARPPRNRQTQKKPFFWRFLGKFIEFED
jgi:hypothetical protein